MDAKIINTYHLPSLNKDEVLGYKSSKTYTGLVCQNPQNSE